MCYHYLLIVKTNVNIPAEYIELYECIKKINGKKEEKQPQNKNIQIKELFVVSVLEIKNENIHEVV